ncbi:unnamed protein product [Amoebophrya sp. A120]|nr:unnamed protein product [Amoebophrya sp. A120]|eukprot:GSA120T00013351001.1
MKASSSKPKSKPNGLSGGSLLAKAKSKAGGPGSRPAAAASTIAGVAVPVSEVDAESSVAPSPIPESAAAPAEFDAADSKNLPVVTADHTDTAEDIDSDDDLINYYNETLQELVEDKKSELLYMKTFLNKIADEVLPDPALNQKLHMGFYRLLMNRMEEIEELMDILMSAPDNSSSADSSSTGGPGKITLDIIQRASEYDIPEELLQAGRQRLQEDQVLEQNRFWHGRNASAVAGNQNRNNSTSNGGSSSPNTTKKQLLDQLKLQQAEEQAKLVEKTEKLKLKMLGFWTLHEKIENFEQRKHGSTLFQEVLKFFDVYANPLMLDLDCVLPAPDVASVSGSAAGGGVKSFARSGASSSSSTKPKTGKTLLQRICNSTKLPHELQLQLLEHLLKKGAHMQLAVSYYVSAQMFNSQIGGGAEQPYTFSHIEEIVRLFVSHFQTQHQAVSEQGGSSTSFHEEDFESCIAALGETVDGKLHGFGYLNMMSGAIDHELQGGQQEDPNAAILEATTLSHKLRDHLATVYDNWKQKLLKKSSSASLSSTGDGSMQIGLPLSKPWPQLFRDVLMPTSDRDTSADAANQLKKIQQTVEQICAWNGKKILNEPVVSNTGANMLFFCSSITIAQPPSSTTTSSKTGPIPPTGNSNNIKPEAIKFLLKKLATYRPASEYFLTDISGTTILQKALACSDDVASLKQEVAQLLVLSEASAFTGLDLLYLQNSEGNNILDFLLQEQSGGDTQAMKLRNWLKDTFGNSNTNGLGIGMELFGDFTDSGKTNLNKMVLGGGGGGKSGISMAPGGKLLTAEEVLSEANLSGPSGRAFQDATRELKNMSADEIRGNSARYQEVKAARDFSDVMGVS